MVTRGIPYANANDDGSVTCPVCDERIIGTGTTEDTITKSAGRQYAGHYTEQHMELSPDDAKLENELRRCSCGTRESGDHAPGCSIHQL